MSRRAIQGVGSRVVSLVGDSSWSPCQRLFSAAPQHRNWAHVVFGACGAASAALYLSSRRQGSPFAVRPRSVRGLGSSAQCAEPSTSTFKEPSQEFVDLVDAPRTPSISIDPSERWVLLMENPPLRSIEDLCREDRRLAGLRFDPIRRLPALAEGYTGMKLRPLFGQSGSLPLSATEAPWISIDGLPAGAKIRSLTWHPQGESLAFVVLPAGVDEEPQLWIVELGISPSRQSLPSSIQAERLTDSNGNPLRLNGIRGCPLHWHPDGRRLLLKAVPWPEPEKPQSLRGVQVPAGPTVQSSTPGVKAPARTFTDLLKTPEDEDEYEWYTTTELLFYDVPARSAQPFGEPGMYNAAILSPDGQYAMISKTARPFSYTVPDTRFPRDIEVWKVPPTATAVSLERCAVERWPVTKRPLRDTIPTLRDAVEDGPRSFSWLKYKPHTLTFWKALDGGDPRKKAEYRDQLFVVDGPPFAVDSASPGPKLEMRYSGSHVTKDGMLLLEEFRWKDRRTRTWVFPHGTDETDRWKLFDYSFEDKYANPGHFVKDRDPATSKSFMWQRAEDGAFLLVGSGASPRGLRPFVDAITLPTSLADIAAPKPWRLWRCVAGPSKPGDEPEDPAKEVGGIVPLECNRKAVYERPASVLCRRGPPLLLFWRESQNEPPNLFARALGSQCPEEEVQLTQYTHPQPALCDVQKELVQYERADGVKLNATLYLPPGYDKEKHGRLPCLMWAYPREFKNAAAAGQISSSPYTFVRGSWSRPLFWVLKGYAVFDNIGMPVVGEGDQEPNDTFVKQVRMNAEAAVDHVVDNLKVADRDRICVGGHSYGAFMTAHLLAHTDGLFRAGICRSGAYNRTLTPFGFQNEERSYWEAPDIYHTIAPFSYAKLLAEKRAPLLFIHGQDDPNPGTYPMQSERFFQALKGHGATAKLVLLPKERHGYLARESILHTLHEQEEWLRLHNGPRIPDQRQSRL